MVERSFSVGVGAKIGSLDLNRVNFVQLIIGILVQYLIEV
jgi:hypothetical protein